jgi:hypothetical protein
MERPIKNFFGLKSRRGVFEFDLSASLALFSSFYSLAVAKIAIPEAF